jgi:hypothetical protein
MSARFGRDFSAVRVHTDAEAVRSSRQLNAQAYTVGANIYFNQGRYAPEQPTGRRLLAHELTHVVQQARAPRVLQREVDDPNATPAATPATAGSDTGAAPATTDTGAGDADAAPAAPGKARKGSVSCSQSGCPQGKQKKETNNDCAASGPADKSNYITHLEVSLSAYTVVAKWSGGGTDQWPCTPYPKKTPKGDDVIGVKCGRNHTNAITPKRKVPDGMSWFAGLSKWNKRYGFHDSQPISKSKHSHGCVRVCCNHAEIINKNTWSGKTTVHIK